MWPRPFRSANCGGCRKNPEKPFPGQGGRPLALVFSLLSAASRHILKNRIPSLLMPPACSTAKGSAVCGCTLPYLAYAYAYRTAVLVAATEVVASGMWHAAGEISLGRREGPAACERVVARPYSENITSLVSGRAAR